MIDGTCDGCWYAVPTISDDQQPMVKCHRFPPAIFVHEGEVAQAFPDASDRCGEYKTEVTVEWTSADDVSPVCICGHSTHLHFRMVGSCFATKVGGPGICGCESVVVKED